MPHLVRWNNELGNYGLVVVGPHVQGGTADKVKEKAQALRVNFTIVQGGGVKGADFTGIPYAMLFDHTGKLIFRGSPFEVEAKLRPAVGAALVDLGQPVKSKTMLPVVEALKKGQSPLALLPRIVPLVKSTDKVTAEEAKLLLDRITDAGLKKVEQAESLKNSDPIEAYYLVEDVPADFKGTPVAAKATTLLAGLRKDKTVIEELKSKPSLEAIRKIDAYLTKQTGGKANAIEDPAFLKANVSTLIGLQKSVQQMQKSFPKARATQEAAQIGEKYGVTLK